MDYNVAKQMQAFCLASPFGRLRTESHPHLLSEPATDYTNPGLGLVHLYSLPVRVYGEKPYTTIEKKIDIDENVQTVQTGTGEVDSSSKTDSEEKSKVSNKLGDAVSDPVLDKLNGRKKEKLDGQIYSSFLHPSSIQTASVAIGQKRKAITKNEPSEPIAKKKPVDQKHKFHLI